MMWRMKLEVTGVATPAEPEFPELSEAFMSWFLLSHKLQSTYYNLSTCFS